MAGKSSIGDYIMVDPTDVPYIDELECAAKTLKHCADIYKRCRGKNDPPPEPLEMAASFLETFALKYKKQLRPKRPEEK